MPRLPTDYSKTIIYVIKCKDDNITEEYIGSTSNFRERKCQHKTVCNNEKSKNYNLKIYNFIRENGGWDEWIMLEIEKYPCNDKREAEKREEEIRVERKAQLNMRKAFIEESYKECNKLWYENNKEQILIKSKQYREDHKEQIKQYFKKYYEANKEERKQYYEANKEEIKEYKKQWGNKEFICKCGWIGKIYSKYKHINNSKQHQDFINK